MQDPIFEELKARFLERNEAFVSAVKKTDKESYISIDSRLLISTLHFQAVDSYNSLMNHANSRKL